MPTIDQLAPATAATDADALVVSQAGITRKLTRSQILAGLQPQIAVPSGMLLGRSSDDAGGPEAVSIGQNLVLADGTLAATAAPYVVADLPSGLVPSAGDLVPLAQSGTNVAITYRQLLSGLPTVPNVDASQTLVTPTGSKTASRLADLTAALLPLSGGTMTGALTLSAAPATPSQAATKAYVDTQIGTALPKTGGALSGPLTLPADPAQAQQAATKSYVDGQVASTLPKSGGSMAGPITLAADPAAPLQAATKQYADQRVLRAGDTLSGALTLAGDPVSPLQAATKSYVDAQVTTALPRSGGTLSGPLVLGGDPASPLQAATKQYVDTRVSRAGDTLTGALGLAADPISPLHAATKAYVDGQVATALPRTGGTLSGSLVLGSDPASAMQAATKQYVDGRVSRAGDTLTGPLTLAGDPAAALQAATKSYVDSQVAGALPKSGGSLTGGLTLAADPTVPAQAATKRYVDAQVATALPLSGGTVSGALTVSATPAAPLQAANKQYVDTQIAGVLPLTGGTLAGALSLAAAPSAPMHAVTKQYVDANPGVTGVINIKMPPYNAQLNGTADDTAAFKAAYQAAPDGSVIYVPNGVTVLQSPGSWGVPLTKRVKWIVDGTKLSNGTPLASAIPTGGGPASLVLPGVVVGNSGSGAEVSQGGSQASDFAVQHSSYIVNHTGGTTGAVAANTRNDTIIYNSPNNYIWGGLDRLIWVGTQTPTASTPAQHVARYVQTIRQSIATDANGQPLPQPEMWAACLEYRDTTGRPSSWATDSLVVEMDWIGNGADDANKRQIQSLVVAQHDRAGAPVEVSSVIGIYLGGGSTGRAYKVFNVGIPFSTAILDTTSSQQLPGAAAIRMAAGHAIAFEPTNSNNLAFDSATGTLRWNQGSLSYVIGKGITVGWQNVCSANTTLAAYLAGNIVFLVGTGAYTITLPTAASVAKGCGFTFSALGSGTVTIAPASGDGIDLGPVTLRQHDRYHIVSDGGTTWREVFRGNAVSPRFQGPPVLPSYTVANLPGAVSAGAKAFASNGRKPAEAAGAGTGVEVFHDGTKWISVCAGTAVLA